MLGLDLLPSRECLKVDIDGAKPSPERPWSINIGRARPRDAGSEATIFVPSGRAPRIGRFITT